MTDTVYFDTSFYVQLERTRHQDKIDFALEIISALRERGVRRVESVELMLELSAGSDLDGKKYLVDLLYHWDPEPLRIDNANIAHVCFGKMFRPLTKVMEMKSDVAALSGHARALPRAPITIHSPEEVLQLTREMASLVAILESVIRSEAFPQDPDIQPLVENSLVEVKMLMGADPKTISEWLAKFIQRVEAKRPGSLLQETIQKNILAGNPRPSQIAEGVASENVKKRHHSTILDLAHLSVFQRNLESIDWLMMDKPAIAALDALAASYVKPFRDRIFSARLDNLIPTLDALGRRASRGTSADSIQ